MRSLALLTALSLGLASCGGSEVSEAQTDAAEPTPAVVEPLTGTLERARAVQQTVDSQAAELRKRLEQAER
jgi:hypothetical protein